MVADINKQSKEWIKQAALNEIGYSQEAGDAPKKPRLQTNPCRTVCSWCSKDWGTCSCQTHAAVILGLWLLIPVIGVVVCITRLVFQ